MKHITKLKLAAVHLYADTQDKSTEWMLQYMQNSCDVDSDCVMNYLQLSEKEKANLKQECLSFYDLTCKLEKLL